ncbi:phospholipase effector Tle1 domain-containing protein [Neoaquamicrobium sediminum]|uniref:phospholipase effector Tle1 domain-containing protein n=1 Tax=Neoaquamicrobium sediminum TaxID=1849104 RepID=UPI0019D5AD85
MPKTILIFSDGTGQIGGMKPDERLSNVYKMYRAMRPGPDSPIDPKRQFAFYDAGLGAGETGGLPSGGFATPSQPPSAPGLMRT